ncbi:MAG: CC_3452 family protein [Caulobacterales bacterium]|jgi:curli biogenesis system outer membrane secretion channel CsgG
MKLLTLAAACAAVATLSAAPAFAAQPVVAKLAQPVPQATKFIAGEAVFNCQGDTCVATAPMSGTFALSACKTVAAKVGALVSYAGDKAMDDARLNACNSVAVARGAGPEVAKR